MHQKRAIKVRNLIIQVLYVVQCRVHCKDSAKILSPKQVSRACTHTAAVGNGSQKIRRISVRINDSLQEDYDMLIPSSRKRLEIPFIG
jgi:hypothetical protein